MSREKRILEVREFVTSNFETVEEYVYGLNLVGAKENLTLFGVDIQNYCKLNLEHIRNILVITLKCNFGLESTEDDRT